MGPGPRAIERLEPRTLCAVGAVPSPVAWFRADSISASDGAAVATWTDLTGHGYSATQTDTAHRPHYSADALNGRPAIEFDAVNATRLSFPRPVSNDFTLVVAFGSEQGLGHGQDWYAGAGLVGGDVPGVADDFGLTLNGFGQVIAGTGGPDTSAASGMGYNDGRAHVATFTRAASTGTISLFVDGVPAATATGTTQPLVSPARLSIGSTLPDAFYFTGAIGEVRVYSAALSAADRAAAENQLLTAYNVAPPPADWFSNPVINRDFPDPGAVYANGTYYAFATNGNGRNVQASSSPDLVHWATLPDALPNLPAWARSGRTWAPDVAVMPNGTYNLYYTAWSRDTGRQAIGVATASNPAGPFTPSLAPLITQAGDGGAIDPSVFTAPDGTRYLLWKNDGNAVGKDTFLYVQALSADGLSLTGTPAALVKQDRPWEGSLVEAPVLWSHGGKYYLFYSANAFRSGAYATGYAVADSIRGPYTKAAAPLLASEGAVVGPGGPEIVEGPDGNTWMLYHSWENQFSYRSTSVDRLDWEGDVPVLRGPSRASQPVPRRPAVAGRYAFYNDSAFDGRDPAPTRADDGAIATDKLPLLPGEVATFANVTSYSRGINGVMFDVTALPRDTRSLPASSFRVETGTGGAWAPGPAPLAVSIRRGEGASGSDRVTLTWPDGAVRDAWLRVTVPTTGSALGAPDVFSFGNLAGETAEGGAQLQVDATDLFAVRHNLFSTSPVTGRYDFNKDGRVSAADLAVVRMNLYRRLAVPAAPASPMLLKDRATALLARGTEEM